MPASQISHKIFLEVRLVVLPKSEAKLAPILSHPLGLTAALNKNAGRNVYGCVPGVSRWSLRIDVCDSSTVKKQTKTKTRSSALLFVLNPLFGGFLFLSYSTEYFCHAKMKSSICKNTACFKKSTHSANSVLAVPIYSSCLSRNPSGFGFLTFSLSSLYLPLLKQKKTRDQYLHVKWNPLTLVTLPLQPTDPFAKWVVLCPIKTMSVPQQADGSLVRMRGAGGEKRPSCFWIVNV